MWQLPAIRALCRPGEGRGVHPGNEGPALGWRARGHEVEGVHLRIDEEGVDPLLIALWHFGNAQEAILHGPHPVDLIRRGGELPVVEPLGISARPVFVVGRGRGQVQHEEPGHFKLLRPS